MRAPGKRLLLAVLVAVQGAPAHAAPDELFAGKSIKLIIGSGPAGGYDLFGRLVARHIGAHLPGQPTVTPQNMPGAGSVVATNYMSNIARKDGLSLAIASPSLALIEALDTPGARFKVGSLNWIGRVSSVVNVMVTWRTSPIKTAEDARTRDALISAISASSPLTLLPKVMNATAGTKFKLIRGYADSAATLLAMERGEVDGTTASWASLKVSRGDWIRDHKMHVITQFGLTRYRELPDTPAATELALAPDDQRLLSLFVGAADVGYAVFTTPGVPPDRVEALRNAFTEMTNDSGFREDAKRQGIELEPMNGAQLQTMIEGMSVFPDSVRARAKEVANAE